jgi:hypothetical protein
MRSSSNTSTRWKLRRPVADSKVEAPQEAGDLLDARKRTVAGATNVSENGHERSFLLQGSRPIDVELENSSKCPCYYSYTDPLARTLVVRWITEVKGA